MTAMWLSATVVLALCGAALGGARCGKCWGDANSNPASCNKPCPCSGGETCYGGLWDDICTKKFPTCAALPASLEQQSSSTDSAFTLADLEYIMKPSGPDAGIPYAEHYGHLVDAMNDYQINTPIRRAQFLAQVAHETNGMCTFWQPVDNGAGDFHMLPINFRTACKYIPKLEQAFAAAFCPGGNCGNEDPCCKGDDHCAGKIIALPRFTHLTAAWWLTEGSYIFNQNCGNLLSAMDCGKGVASSGFPYAVSSGFYLITQCIYGFGGSQPGTEQRETFLTKSMGRFGNPSAQSGKCKKGGVAPSRSVSTYTCPVVPTPPGQCPKGSGGTTRCGASWGAANSGCGCTCALDSDCPSGSCYSSLSAAPCANQPPPSPSPPTPSPPPPSPPTPSPPTGQCPKGSGSGSKVRCGTSWGSANGQCGCKCSVDGDCPSGACFAGLADCTSPPPPTPTPPTPTPPTPTPPTPTPPTPTPPSPPTGGGQVCKSISAAVTDAWCASVACDASFTAYCQWTSGGSGPSPSPPAPAPGPSPTPPAPTPTPPSPPTTSACDSVKAYCNDKCNKMETSAPKTNDCQEDSSGILSSCECMSGAKIYAKDSCTSTSCPCSM